MSELAPYQLRALAVNYTLWMLAYYAQRGDAGALALIYLVTRS